MKTSFICPECNRKFEYGTQLQSTPEICPECLMKNYNNIPTYKAGSQVGDYVIIKTIGVGGMGEVFLAEQKSVKREVALKILQPVLAKDQQYLERFFQEVRTLAQIEHPNIVQAIEAGIDGPTCYFSMMYITGKDLKRIMDEGKIFPEFEALQIIRNIACALEYAWKKYKLIHRDIKPANIMLTQENEVALMDLGISKTLSSDTQLTSPGMMMGSPAYISPEQAKADVDIDFRADIYSLGATFFHLITGVVPFDSDNSTVVIAKQLSEKVPDPRNFCPEISEKSVKLIYKMMEKDKRDRFSTWHEAIDAIDEILSPMLRLQDGENDENKTPLIDTIKNKIPQDLRKSSPYRIAALGILLVFFLMAFTAVVTRSVKEADYKKYSAMYDEAMSIIKSGNQEDRLKAVAILEKVTKSGFPELSVQSAKSIEEIRMSASAAREKAVSARKLDALKNLKQKSFEFEKQNNYLKALELWGIYKERGEFKDDKMFQEEIARSLEYMKIKQRQKEQGLLDE